MKQSVGCLVWWCFSRCSLPTLTKCSQSWRYQPALALRSSTRCRYVLLEPWSRWRLPARQLTSRHTWPASSTDIAILSTAIPGRTSGKELVWNWNWFNSIYRVAQKTEPVVPLDEKVPHILKGCLQARLGIRRGVIFSHAGLQIYRIV